MTAELESKVRGDTGQRQCMMVRFQEDALEEDPGN